MDVNYNVVSSINQSNKDDINHGSEIERILGEINAIKRDSLNIKRVYFNDNIEILDFNRNNNEYDDYGKSRNSTKNKKSILKNDDKRMSNSINFKDLTQFNNGLKRNTNIDIYKNGSFYNTENNRNTDRGSILHYQSNIISDIRNKLYEEGKRKKEEDELRECTFNPKTEINSKLNLQNKYIDSNVYERNLAWKAKKENNMMRNTNRNVEKNVEFNKTINSNRNNEYNTYSNKISTPSSVKKDNLFYTEMDYKTKIDLKKYKERLSEAEKKKSDSLNKAFPNYSKMYDMSHKTHSNLEIIGNKVGKDNLKNNKFISLSYNECNQILQYLKNDLYLADLEVEFK